MNLLDELRTGTIDAAVLALPVDQPGLMIQPLYDEDFVAAVPADHQLAQKDVITREDIKRESMLILGAGHCFRDQVLDFCADGVRSDPNGKKRIEGSSLQTILNMVAQGLGVTILPPSSAPYYRGNAMVRIIPFEYSETPCGACLAKVLPAPRGHGRPQKGRGSHLGTLRLSVAHKPAGRRGVKPWVRRHHDSPTARQTAATSTVLPSSAMPN